MKHVHSGPLEVNCSSDAAPAAEPGARFVQGPCGGRYRAARRRHCKCRHQESFRSALTGWARREDPDLTAVHGAIAEVLRDFAAQIATDRKTATRGTDLPESPECPPTPPGEWRMRAVLASAIVTLTKGEIIPPAAPEPGPAKMSRPIPGRLPECICRACHRICLRNRAADPMKIEPQAGEFAAHLGASELSPSTRRRRPRLPARCASRPSRVTPGSQ